MTNIPNPDSAPWLRDFLLHDNPWLQLREVRDPGRGVVGYVYSHERRCNGQIVAIMPTRCARSQAGVIHEYLLRHEVCPPWGTAPVACSITGGMDHDGESHAAVALRELKEEAGYVVDESDLVYLGSCRGMKSTDTQFHLYSVDLTGFKPGTAQGDGSRLEAEAWCEWTEGPLSESPDPLVGAIWLRLSGT